MRSFDSRRRGQEQSAQLGPHPGRALHRSGQDLDGQRRRKRRQKKEKREMCGGLPSSLYRVLLRVPGQEAERDSSTHRRSRGPKGRAVKPATGAIGSGADEGGSAGIAGCSESGQRGLGELTGASGGPEAGGCSAGAGRLALGTSKIKTSTVMTRPTTPRFSPHTPTFFEEHDRALEGQLEPRRGPDRRRGGHWRPIVGACLPYAKWRTPSWTSGCGGPTARTWTKL